MIASAFFYSLGKFSLPSFSTKGSPPVDLPNTTRIILAWTPIFGDWNFWYPPGLGYRPFSNELCHYDDCHLTTDKAYLASASAVLFHCRDSFERWPETRSRSQLYGVVCHESPTYSEFVQYGDKINITLTYRRDSDVFFPQCWFDRLQAPSNVSKYELRIPLRSRRRAVVWPVSNCNTASKRELYVRQLKQHVEIDIYGSCGTLVCPKSRREECSRQFSRDYKFYLAFENSVCTDYVSEKLFTPMQHEIIPIVLGGADYSFFPKHSYINVDDFPSPKRLAAYLDYLSTNETAFGEYFQWRLHYRLTCLNKEKLFCDLCRMLHDGYKNQYRDASSWWSKDSCDNNKLIKLI